MKYFRIAAAVYIVHYTTLKNPRNMKSVSRAKVLDFKVIFQF